MPVVPGGVFHHCSAWPQSPVGFGAFDDRFGHSILHAPSRIRRFQLGNNTPYAWRDDFSQFDQRRVANSVKDAVRVCF